MYKITGRECMCAHAYLWVKVDYSRNIQGKQSDSIFTWQYKEQESEINWNKLPMSDSVTDKEKSSCSL